MDKTEFYILCKKFADTDMSIRQFCNKENKISRSNFHKRIHSDLPTIDKRLYLEISEKLRKNYAHRKAYENHSVNEY